MSKEQSSFIKGLGILLIMVHNFVDILLGISSNEMAHFQKAIDKFLAHVFTADFAWYIFSFAGWIGVSIFIFISGYGLTKKYNATNTIKTGTYIKDHVVKLWKLMLPIYLIYFCLYRTNIQSALAQISFTINLLSYSYGKNGFIIDPGVYWFFGAILQFYLLFLLLRKLSTRWLWVLCAVFLVVQYCIVYCVSYDMANWMRHNFVGWGVPFLLGMIAARSQLNISKPWNTALCAASFLILCACLVIRWLAPLTEVATIVFFVTLSRMATWKWACFIGIISPSIFALHPLIRMLFYSLCFKPEYVLVLTIAYSAVVILLSWVHHKILNNPNLLKFKRTT